MKIKNLKLENYGRFEHLEIDFAPTAEKTGNVTVIVGNNGAGKSQILQALATGLSWFVANLKADSGIGFEIEEQFIKNGKNEASIIVGTDFGAFNTLSLLESYQNSWRITNVREGRVGNHIETKSLAQLTDIAKKYRKALTNNNNLSLPLVAFYSTERASLQYVEAEVLSHGYDQIKGYFACLDGASIDFSEFLKWFRNAEDIENEKKATSRKSIEELSDAGEKLISQIQQFLDSETIDNEGEIDAKLLKNYKEKTEKELKELKVLQKIHEVIPQDLSLFHVKIAIEHFTDFKNPRIRRQGTPTMIIEKDDEELDVNQLSQGEKSLLALVGDIARRLAILNPSLDNPLEGEGVVMIDEVDLHLHPKWQHDLIDKLVKTFPNVQFILTTHSPHVISDRSDILVYSLDDGELEEVPNVYGQDVNTVLTKVFDVDIRDSKVEIQLNDIRRAITHKDYATAEEGIETLAKKMPVDDLELLKCRLMLAQAKVEDKNERDHAND